MLSSLPVALVTLLSLASAATAIPTSFDRLYGIEPRATADRCGSNPTPEVVSAREKAFASLVAEKKASDSFTAAEGSYTVPVNFNVIYASTNISDGYVP
jgi:hypothetical protein